MFVDIWWLTRSIDASSEFYFFGYLNLFHFKKLKNKILILWNWDVILSILTDAMMLSGLDNVIWYID